MTRAKTLVFGPSHWHVPLYAERIAERHDVVGITDENQDGAARYVTHWDAPFYSTWQDLLSQHRDADLAYVFVAHDTMRAVCLSLIDAGIPFVVEKPAGISLHELDEIRDAAAAAGVPIAVPLVQQGAPIARWLDKAGPAIYENSQFIAGPPTRYLESGSPWMLELERAGGGCLVNLAPHFVDAFLRSSGASSVDVSAATSSSLHQGRIEDFAAVTLTTGDGRIATIEVGYAFPISPLKRHCSFLRVGSAGTATIWTNGAAVFTGLDGSTETARIDVDSDPLYAVFVDRVADELSTGFAGLPSIDDLHAAMVVIWDAYAKAHQGGNHVDTQSR